MQYSKEKTEIEKERLWLGKITNPEQLRYADDIIHMTQFFTCEKNDAGSARMRCTNFKECDLTIKLNTKDKTSRIEITEPVTKEQFKAYLKLVPEYIEKTRYAFRNKNGTNWEIDVFENSDYCRIEIEYENLSDIPNNFPIDLEDVIDALSEENKELIDSINKSFLVQRKAL